MARLRPRTKQFLTVGGIGALSMLFLCMIAGYFIYTYLNNVQNEKRYAVEQELEATKKKLDEQLGQRRNVSVLKQDVKAGQKITADMIQVLAVPKNTLPEDILPEEDVVGKHTKFNMLKNTTLLEPMLYKEGVTPNDLRIQELKVIMLPLELKKDDFVDVRIVFPDGQDFIVLSKKKVKNLSNGVVWHHMDETEILRMSSAIVDAYINDAQIYAIKYVDPYMQDEAIVTYPSNEKVLDLMQRDPNIVKEASVELEKRLRVRLEKDLNAIDPMDLQKYVSRKTGEQSIQGNITPPQPEGEHPPVIGSDPTSTMPENIAEKVTEPSSIDVPSPPSQPEIQTPSVKGPNNGSPTITETPVFEKGIEGVSTNG
ncbi:SAF domain-containing protein [Paenibacillus agilis]|uniref:SAF domain-containing protein n=1 Tax=Paenibacillus agilis TaxID=3020863 RepID=A0A559ID74_9BACL|nr:SAF domain-containing protein [Paenibacillus agilis]TVX85621.1 hypothetical protein FPZ44_25040 [Paenibacillus agilis]